MTLHEIKTRLEEFCNIFRFEYQGVNCYFDPLRYSDKWGFDVVCGEDCEYMEFDDVTAAITAPLFLGKSLSEIYTEIDIIEV